MAHDIPEIPSPLQKARHERALGAGAFHLDMSSARPLEYFLGKEQESRAQAARHQAFSDQRFEGLAVDLARATRAIEEAEQTLWLRQQDVPKLIFSWEPLRSPGEAGSSAVPLAVAHGQIMATFSSVTFQLSEQGADERSAYLTGLEHLSHALEKGSAPTPLKEAIKEVLEAAIGVDGAVRSRDQAEIPWASANAQREEAARVQASVPRTLHQQREDRERAQAQADRWAQGPSGDSKPKP